MEFDIVPITQAELDGLSTIQVKLLRTAQQKKNELKHKLEKELEAYRLMIYTNGVTQSSLYSDKSAELTAEYDYQVEILKEQLLFNMSLKEPTTGDETGNPTPPTEETGYIVDYELSYVERYIIVRDYYMSIEDPNERLALYTADEVALAYLGSYYNSLFTYFKSFT